MKREVLAKGAFLVIHTTVGQRQLGVVHAVTTKGALRAAARKFGIPAADLDVLQTLPTVYRATPPK